MNRVSSRLNNLRKRISIPYRLQYVDRVVEPKEFEEKVIYIHITI